VSQVYQSAKYAAHRNGALQAPASYTAVTC